MSWALRVFPHRSRDVKRALARRHADIMHVQMPPQFPRLSKLHLVPLPGNSGFRPLNVAVLPSTEQGHSKSQSLKQPACTERHRLLTRVVSLSPLPSILKPGGTLHRQPVRHFSSHKHGLQNLPKWVSKVGYISIGTVALVGVSFAGFGVLALSAAAVTAWVGYRLVYPAIQAFSSSRRGASNSVRAAFARARRGDNVSGMDFLKGGRLDKLLSILRDAVVVKIGATLLTGEYANFALAELTEKLLNADGGVRRVVNEQHLTALHLEHGVNQLQQVKDGSGGVHHWNPTLTLAVVVLDEQGRPCGRARVQATYESVEVTPPRSWREWAKTVARKTGAALSSKPQGKSDSEKEGAEEWADPVFMGQLREAILNLPEIVFSPQELTFEAGTWSSDFATFIPDPHRDPVIVELSQHATYAAVDFIPGQLLINQAAEQAAASGSAAPEFQSGLEKTWEEFQLRRRAVVESKSENTARRGTHRAACQSGEFRSTVLEADFKVQQPGHESPQ